MIIENFATLREEIQSVSITYDVVYLPNRQIPYAREADKKEVIFSSLLKISTSKYIKIQ